MMGRLTILALLLVELTACQNLEKVETRDASGNLQEVYYRRKTDFARQGAYISYYPGGKVFEKATYRADTLDGQRILYFENGQVQIEENYRKGRFEGPYKAYYENGQVELEGSYVDNEMSGDWTRYYPNGQVLEVVHFEKNEENGPFTEYHPNGKLKAEGQYLSGDFEHGELKLYDTLGVLERRMNCDRGICRTSWLRDSLPPN